MGSEKDGSVNNARGPLAGRVSSIHWAGDGEGSLLFGYVWWQMLAKWWGLRGEWSHNWRAQAGRDQRAVETLMEREAVIPCGWVRTEGTGPVELDWQRKSSQKGGRKLLIQEIRTSKKEEVSLWLLSSQVLWRLENISSLIVCLDSTNQYRNGSARLSRILIQGSSQVTLSLRCFWGILMEISVWRL